MKLFRLISVLFSIMIAFNLFSDQHKGEKKTELSLAKLIKNHCLVKDKKGNTVQSKLIREAISKIEKCKKAQDQQCMVKSLKDLGIIMANNCNTFLSKEKKTNDSVEMIEKLQTQACSCASKECSVNALKDFRALFLKVKDMKVKKDQYNRIKNAAATITRCLMKNGITAKQIMSIVR